MKYIKFAIILGFLLLSLFAPFNIKNAGAVTSADWRAGRIIDDYIFTNSNDMSVSGIQDFLNSKVPSCDTNGTRPASEYGRPALTHAQYAAMKGWAAPPYICLRDYYEVPKTSPGPGIPANNYTGTIPAGAISASQMIYDAAQQYRINPKVLLVKLGTESHGPLTSDSWPLRWQYTFAMGAHCPDSGPGGSANCDTNYAGFSIQIREAASLLRWYLDGMTQSWWQYRKPYQVNSILWKPITSGCGSGDVYIESKATAALYTYTPYQPNQAALNNMYGLGDSCSSYGNRNFWRVYNDWFNYIDTVRNSLTMNIVTAPDATPAKGQTVQYTVSFTNTLASDIVLDAIGVVGRYNNAYTGASRDFGWVGPITLKPGVAQTFTFSRLIEDDSGTVYAWPAVNFQGKYIHYNNWGSALVVHKPSLTVTSPLAASSQHPTAGQSLTLSATVKNEEDQPIRVDSIGIPVRYYGTYAYDTAWLTPPGNALGAGESVNLSGTINVDKPGPYTAWVSWKLDSSYSSLSTQTTLQVTKPTPSFALTYIETPNPSPALGEDVIVKFKLKNNRDVPMTLDAIGVVGRYGNPYSGPNRDFGWVGPETFAANEEKSYTTFASNVTDLQTFYAWVALRYQGTYVHYNSWGFQMTPHLPNLNLVAPIVVNGGGAAQLGSANTMAVSVKNNEPKPIRFSALGIPVRYYGVYNYDAAWLTNGTFAAAGQAGDTIALNGSLIFDKPGPYTAWASVNINGKYITIGSTQTIKL